MSNFKNYQQQGVASDVQFGKGGGRLVFANGIFTFVANPTGTNLARLQVAAPVDPEDAVTFSALTDAINAVYGKVDRNASNVALQLAAITSAVSTIKLDAIASASAAATIDTGLTLTSSATPTTLALSVNPTNATIKVSTSVVTDADLVLAPQGAGSVVIGDGSEDGLIQPSGGHSLTIAGGDANTAGSVVIRGGKGSTPGYVEIHNLKDPVDPQDAVTLASSTAAIAKAVQGAAEGSIRAVVATFKEVAGDTVVASVPAGTLLRLKVAIEAPFAPDATITVKTSASTLALPAAIDESQMGLYTVELFEGTTEDHLIVSVATSGGTGSGGVVLEYIAA